MFYNLWHFIKTFNSIFVFCIVFCILSKRSVGISHFRLISIKVMVLVMVWDAFTDSCSSSKRFLDSRRLAFQSWAVCGVKWCWNLLGLATLWHPWVMVFYYMNLKERWNRLQLVGRSGRKVISTLTFLRLVWQTGARWAARFSRRVFCLRLFREFEKSLLLNLLFVTSLHIRSEVMAKSDGEKAWFHPKVIWTVDRASNLGN